MLFRSVPNGWNDLKELRVAVRRGSISITNIAKKHAKNIYELDTIPLQLRFLCSSRADIAIGNPDELDLVLDSEEFRTKGIRRLSPPLSELPIFGYLHRKHAGLVQPVTEALQEMKKDGTYDLIVKDIKKSTQ